MSTTLPIRNILAVTALGLSLCGCTSFVNGMASGVAGTGAGYEISARNQMKTLDKDLKEGKIDEAEYEIRKDQIERGSIVY